MTVSSGAAEMDERGVLAGLLVLGAPFLGEDVCVSYRGTMSATDRVLLTHATASGALLACACGRAARVELLAGHTQSVDVGARRPQRDQYDGIGEIHARESV